MLKGYSTRYRNPHSNIILEGSRYLKNGKLVVGIPEYKVDGVWVGRNDVPERREYEKNYNSTLERFMIRHKSRIKSRNKKWTRQNKVLLGENEFLEKKTSNKLMDHYKKQIERYGDKCPITLIKFTTIREYIKKIDGRLKLFSNLSTDRILNHINYTKQNTLFTATGWNISRGELELSEFKYLFKDEIIKRYKEILIERFPDQEYEA